LIINVSVCTRDIPEDGGENGGEDMEENGEEDIDFVHFYSFCGHFGISVHGY